MVRIAAVGQEQPFVLGNRGIRYIVKGGKRKGITHKIDSNENQMRIIFRFIALTLLTAPAYAELIGHYDFDANADDSSGNAYHGVQLGNVTVTEGAPGLNSALALNLGQIDLPKVPAYDFGASDSFSVSIWVNIEPIATSDLDNMSIISNFKSHASEENYWGIYLSDGFNGKTPGMLHLGPEIDDSEWHHLTYVRDTSTGLLSFYHNGDKVLEAIDVSGNLTNSNPVNIGNHLNRLYPLIVDELRIYDIALTENQVKALASNNDGFLINPAISDAWFFPDTAGQGFFIIVWEDSKLVFLAWFTYDTERPPEDVTAILGEPGHRWLTALGPYDGDSALLDVFLSSGMIFDSAVPPVTTEQMQGATIEIVWSDCKTGLVTYNIPTLGLMGEIPIERIVEDKVAACLVAQAQ